MQAIQQDPNAQKQMNAILQTMRQPLLQAVDAPVEPATGQVELPEVAPEQV